ncbi:MAG TPA: hypothetical protein VH063_05005 [Gaiellaceae bacterium]|jgi:hypothetical protein|nr:hypothetical protein [Gaiellaceae bacterium]
MVKLDRATSPLADGRDVVVYPRGASWGFRLPEEHTITVRKELGSVSLARPGHGSGYRLDRVEELEGEVRVFLGFPLDEARTVGSGLGAAGVRPYSLTVIHDELERLEADLAELGGEASEEEQGGGYGPRTEALRAAVRGLRQ